MAPEQTQTESAQAQQTEPVTSAGAYQAPKGAVRPHNLTPLAGTSDSAEVGNMDLLMDVSVPVIAHLGSAEMRIRDVLRLAPGSIVELNKLAGEPVDLMVRGQLFAQGEVVVVDDAFGVRISQIVGQSGRDEKSAG